MGLLTRYLTASPTVDGEAHGGAGRVVAHESTVANATWPASEPGAAIGQVHATRAEAMAVPAVARARNVICGSVGMLPLAAWTEEGQKIRRPRPWLAQPERDLAAAVTLAWTADDLLFYGRACWQAVRNYSDDGRPLTFRRIPAWRVQPEYATDGLTIVGWLLDGTRAPRTGPGRLVIFTGLDDGLLTRAGTTIKTAAALERAARNYADEPVPAAILRNTSGAHLTDKRVEELLASWRTARKTKATAYLDALELTAVGLDPAGMQLVEARQHMAIEIARACNIAPDYIGANESGSSVTYQNVTQERRKLVDFTLRHYLSPVEQRLTMDDVTTAGQSVRFDLDDFLRADPQTRAVVEATLLDAGVLTVAEAREREGLAAGVTPPPRATTDDEGADRG